MEQPQRIRLRLPEQDLHHLTQGSTNPKKMQEWVEALPMANVGESARLLYQLIQELNRLRTDGKTRYALLEAVRPALVHIERQLGKHYLGQSVVLPEKARKVAGLAQSLLAHLATGYKLVAIETVRKARDKEFNRIATTSIHRAMIAMGEVLLRCYQLYIPVPKFHWLEMHQLYLLADGHGLAQVEVEDKTFRKVQSTTVREAYARTLLLATARTNQLRQQEIEQAWVATEEWCALLVINETRADSDIFAFDLQVDAPPTYRKHASQAGTHSMRSIDAKSLSARLKSASDSGAMPDKGADFTFPRGFTRELAAHLSQAWGNLSERAFQRVASSGPIEICVGLGATHYFLSDGQDFESLIRGSQLKILHEEKDNPFLTQRSGRGGEQIDVTDAWSHAFDGGGFRMADTADFSQVALEGVHGLLGDAAAAARKPKFESNTCQIVNSSPGGYCIEWAGEMPGHIRTSELVGLRDNGARTWSIGVIRWIKQLPAKGAQMGIELLAPKALPCATRVIKQTGETTEWMRTLLLPELRAIGQDATLVTPAMAFATGYKVYVNQGGQETKASLYRQINATAGFRQFLFRALEQPNIPAGSPPPGDDFDSIWSSL